MNITVDALHEKLHILKEQGQKWLQHSNTMRKIEESKRYLQKHAMFFTVLGIIAFVILSPFLLISLVVMAPLVVLFCSVVALLIMSSFVFGLLLNCSLVVFAVVASCYILYRISWFAICRIQICCTYLESCLSRMCRYFRTQICEFPVSHQLECVTDELTQQSTNVEKHSGYSGSSELEDIEPDYRDREAKLYEALISRPQNTGQDTFEPFP